MLAVNKPPHDPEDGQATHSSSCRSSSLIVADAVLADPFVDVADRHVAGRGSGPA